MTATYDQGPTEPAQEKRFYTSSFGISDLVWLLPRQAKNGLGPGTLSAEHLDNLLGRRPDRWSQHHWAARVVGPSAHAEGEAGPKTDLPFGCRGWCGGD
jgi:hypothetical protein